MKITEIRCLCGTVVVQIQGKPMAQFYCHCDDCQANSGGAYIGVAVYPTDAVQVMQGELTTWTLKTLPRQRCTVCGTYIMAEVPGLEQCGIKANLLPPGAFHPDFHLHCRYAVLPVKDDLPHFKDLPASFGGSNKTVNW